MSIKYGSLREEHLAHRAEKETRDAEAREERKQQLAEKPATLTQEMQVASSTLSKRAVGRPKGSLCKRVQEARELVTKVGLDPLEFLLRVAKNRRLPLDQRVRAAAAACLHVHPKLAVSHVTKEIDHSVEFRSIQVLAASDPAVAEAMEQIVLKLSKIDKERVHDAMFTQPTALLAEPESSEVEESTERGDEEDTQLFGPE
jgi:hypothetical protein